MPVVLIPEKNRVKIEAGDVLASLFQGIWRERLALSRSDPQNALLCSRTQWPLKAHQYNCEESISGRRRGGVPNR